MHGLPDVLAEPHNPIEHSTTSLYHNNFTSSSKINGKGLTFFLSRLFQAASVELIQASVLQ